MDWRKKGKQKAFNIISHLLTSIDSHVCAENFY